MFSGTMKVLGAMFLAIGVIVAIVGALGMTAAFLDESDNQDQDGFLGLGKDPDEERSERNAEVGAGGAAALGTGITTIIVGTIFLIVGVVTTRREAGQQQQQVVIVGEGAEPPRIN